MPQRWPALPVGRTSVVNIRSFVAHTGIVPGRTEAVEWKSVRDRRAAFSQRWDRPAG
jgi:hypothetical protein